MFSVESTPKALCLTPNLQCLESVVIDFNMNRKQGGDLMTNPKIYENSLRRWSLTVLLNTGFISVARVKK